MTEVEISFLLPDGQLQLIVFDAVTRDVHESTAEITEHPIEEGANISDHVRPNLDTVELQAIVSNHPIREPRTQMDGVIGAQGELEITGVRSPPFVGALGAAARVVLGGAPVVLAKANVLLFDGEVDRVRTVYDELLRLKNSGTVIGILTSLRNYDNMLIRRISPIREAASGNSLFVTVEATEVNIVSSEVADAPDPEETRGGVNQNTGQQNTDDADETSNARNQSWAAGLVDAGVALSEEFD